MKTKKAYTSKHFTLVISLITMTLSCSTLVALLGPDIGIALSDPDELLREAQEIKSRLPSQAELDAMGKDRHSLKYTNRMAEQEEADRKRLALYYRHVSDQMRAESLMVTYEKAVDAKRRAQANRPLLWLGLIIGIWIGTVIAVLVVWRRLTTQQVIDEAAAQE